MRRSRLRGGILAVGFLCLLSSVSFGNEDLNKQIKDQQVKLRQVSMQVEYYNRELEALEDKRKSYLKELSSFDQRIKVSDEQIKLLNLQIKKNEEEIKELSGRIEVLVKRIDYIKELLEQRLVVIYKYGGLVEFNLLLSAENLVEVEGANYMLARLAKRDEEMIKELEVNIVELNESNVKLEIHKNDLNAKKASLTKEKESNQVASKQRRALLAQLEKDKKASQAAVKELQSSEAALGKKIESLIKQREASYKKGDEMNRLRQAHKGKLSWPVIGGTITSNFGTRIHPTLKTRSDHTGIDIAIKKGTPVKCAGSGVVIYTGWQKGYGQVIIVDHGNELFTVYAHLDSIYSETGQNVDVNTVIGAVGNTGLTTGVHLHFEVRDRKGSRDPLSYLGSR